MTEATRAEQVDDRLARKTTLVVAVVLALIAGFTVYRGRTTLPAVLASVSAALFLVALLSPPLARRFHTAWMGLAAVLGYVNSRILLSLMYYGVFTPFSVVMRLAGRDHLRRRGAKSDSYWVRRKTTRQTKEQFERLF